MTTFGTVNCFPSPRFTLPRSYVEGIVLPLQSQPYTFDGYNLRVAVGLPVVFWFNVNFNHHFMDWSSNSYSLDRVVDEVSYDVNGGVFHNPYTANMTYGFRAPFSEASLFFDFLILFGPNVALRLAGAPSGYWLPRPLQ